MTIEQLPQHVNNKQEVIKLIRKYEKSKNPYLGYRIAELLGYEPDGRVTCPDPKPRPVEKGEVCF